MSRTRPALGDVLRDLDGVRVRLTEREHVQLEVLTREQPRRVEHGDVEVFVERHCAGLELAHHLMVAMLEVVFLDAELLKRTRALLAIPAVGAEDAADVEEDVREGQFPAPLRLLMNLLQEPICEGRSSSYGIDRRGFETDWQRLIGVRQEQQWRG